MFAPFARFAAILILVSFVYIGTSLRHPVALGQEKPAATGGDSLAKATPADARLPWIWKEQRTLKGHRTGIWSAAFSPDDKLLITGATGHQGPAAEFKIWEVATGRELKAVTVKTKYSGTVRSLQFSPDGKTFASAEHDREGAAQLRDAATAEVIRSFVGHKKTMDTLAISNDGERLATTSLDGTVIIWNIKTGELLHTLEGHQDAVYPVSFSRQDRRVLSGDAKGVAILWDADTGKSLHTLRGHKKAIQVTAFSKDGKTLVTGSWDETLKLWDAATGAEVATLQGHAAGVMGMALSRDGRMLASSSGRWGYEYTQEEAVKKSTGEMILWDFETRKPLVIFHPHKDSIFGVAFTSDGKTLVTTSFDKEIKIWRGFQATKAPAPLTGQDLENIWDRLASDDLVQKNGAVELLGGMPEQSLPFLLERLRAVKPTDAEKSAAELIGQLSDEKLKVREMATLELAKLGAAVAPQLRVALDKRPSVEARRRLNRLLVDAPPELTRDQQRLQYAAIAVELTATPEAYQALTQLSDGVAGGLIAEEANAALKRRAFVEK